MQIIVSHYFAGVEKAQMVFNSMAEARKKITEGNANAARAWSWGLSEANWLKEDGTRMTKAEEEAIRNS